MNIDGVFLYNILMMIHIVTDAISFQVLGRSTLLHQITTMDKFSFGLEPITMPCMEQGSLS